MRRSTISCGTHPTTQMPLPEGAVEFFVEMWYQWGSAKKRGVDSSDRRLQIFAWFFPNVARSILFC